MELTNVPVAMFHEDADFYGAISQTATNLLVSVIPFK